MIEHLEGFPENVVAVAGKGQVTKKDYEEVLIPAVEAAFERHKKVRFYYELGPQFSGIEPGAAWEDLKIGVQHLTGWERLALVTEVDWIRHMVNAFRVFMPGVVRVFPNGERATARAWIIEGGN